MEWSEEPVRNFETSIEVTVVNGKGALARVAGALSAAEADIVHVDMGNESPQDTADLRFVIAVRDLVHLETVLRQLKRTSSVIQAARQTNKGHFAA